MIAIVFLVLAGVILGIGVLIALFSSELKVVGGGVIVTGLVIAGLVFDNEGNVHVDKLNYLGGTNIR